MQGASPVKPRPAAAVWLLVKRFLVLAIGASALVAGVHAAEYGEHVADEATIAVDGAWARPAAAAMNSAAYMHIRNAGDEDTLVGAASDAALAMEIHRTTMDGGVMRMEPAGDVPIPAGGAVEMKPGGLHVMLIGLHQELADGAHIEVTLQFERFGALTVPVAVRHAGG